MFRLDYYQENKNQGTESHQDLNKHGKNILLREKAN